MNIKTYTVQEAAEILRCSKSSVYNLVQNGEICPTTKAGKKIMIPEVALKSYLLKIPVKELLLMGNEVGIDG